VASAEQYSSSLWLKFWVSKSAQRSIDRQLPRGLRSLLEMRPAKTYDLLGDGIVLKEWFFTPNFGLNLETVSLAAEIILTLVALAGATIVKAVLKLTSPGKAVSTADPRRTPTPALQ
jgi:hypothetical protein